MYGSLNPHLLFITRKIDPCRLKLPITHVGHGPPLIFLHGLKTPPMFIFPFMPDKASFIGCWLNSIPHSSIYLWLFFFFNRNIVHLASLSSFIFPWHTTIASEPSFFFFSTKVKWHSPVRIKLLSSVFVNLTPTHFPSIQISCLWNPNKTSRLLLHFLILFKCGPLSFFNLKSSN